MEPQKITGTIPADACWQQGTEKDIAELTEMFWANLTGHPEYISHGELQMGVACAPGVPAEKGKRLWQAYIREKIGGARRNYLTPEGVLPAAPGAEPVQGEEWPSAVFLYRAGGRIAAFCILEVSNDGDKPFGILCDMLVRPEYRSHGLGKQMLAMTRTWFGNLGITDIYLESGVNNHAAHVFFERQGFRQVSHIFKWF